MSLLSASEKAEIRAATKQATDTFMVTPVTYYNFTKNLDRWSEGEDTTPNPIPLKALAESKADDKLEALPEGSIDFKEIKLTLNLDDFDTAGLYDSVNNDLKVKIEEDYFVVRGKQFKVVDAYSEGPLEARDLLVVIWGKLNDTEKGI